jgi:hypothetical protein
MAAVEVSPEVYELALHRMRFPRGEDEDKQPYSEFTTIITQYPALLTYSKYDDNNSHSLLMEIAIRSQDISLVKIMLEKGFDKNVVLPFKNFDDEVMNITAHEYAKYHRDNEIGEDADDHGLNEIIELLNPVENMVLDGGYRKKYRQSRKAKKSKKSRKVRKYKKNRKSSKQNY